MSLKSKSPEPADPALHRFLPEAEQTCCTSEDSHRCLILVQRNGAVEGFPLTWLYRWQWQPGATQERLAISLTDHEVTVHGKQLDRVAELLSNGKGLRLQIKDARYQSLLRPNEIFITAITIQQNAKCEPAQN
jgi:hypothetical protein